jgi:hypothetical protein
MDAKHVDMNFKKLHIKPNSDAQPQILDTHPKSKILSLIKPQIKASKVLIDVEIGEDDRTKQVRVMMKAVKEHLFLVYTPNY